MTPCNQFGPLGGRRIRVGRRGATHRGRGNGSSDLAPMIGPSLVAQVSHASDMRRMTVLARPLYGVVLRLRRVQHAVGMILDHKVGDGAALGTAFRARFKEGSGVG